ncbi:MAG TPA: hypothetical protein VK277_07760 [Acidimicrobiales bacterium]|nr:hypothetical protein [Acidimicrobiales bacterium]
MDKHRTPRAGAKRPTWLVLALVVLACSLLASACGGGPSATSDAGGKGTTTTKAGGTSKSTPLSTVPDPTKPTLPPPALGSTITVNGRAYQVPTELNGQPISPTISLGTNIVLTKYGFEPYHLNAFTGSTITWTNLSPRPVIISILYADPKVHSPLIPPGGTWRQTYPDLYDFVYVTNTGFYGRVSVGAYQT